VSPAAASALAPRIVICSAAVGCGHTRAGVAVKQALGMIAPSAEVHLLEALDFAAPWFVRVYRDAYLRLISGLPAVAGWMYHATDGRPGEGGSMAPVERRALRGFVEHPLLASADVILCTHFLCARVLSPLRRAGQLTAALCVGVTDQHPHAVWLVPGADRFLLPSAEAQATAIRAGINPTRTVATGIPIDPRFASAADRAAARAALGLPEDRPVALLAGGGLGLGGVDAALAAVLGSGRRVHAAVICGRSADLHRKVSRLAEGRGMGTGGGGVPEGPTCSVVGFTNRMPEFMAAADVLVGKPGGLTTAEAAASGLPMVLLRPIPGQEDRNARLLVEGGAAVLRPDPGQAGAVAAELAGDAPRLRAMRQAARAFGRSDSAMLAARAVLGLLTPEMEDRALAGRGNRPEPVAQSPELDPGLADLPCVRG
jgi:processive 1,2-diacylglycerol beta-glucosyltransferase